MPERLLVKRFDYKKELPARGKYKAKSVYVGDFEKANGEPVKDAEVIDFGHGPIPVGVFIEADVEENNFGYELRNVKAEGLRPVNTSSTLSGVSARPVDVGGLRSGRAHAQEMALRYWEIAIKVGHVQPGQFSLEAVLETAGRFEDHVNKLGT